MQWPNQSNFVGAPRNDGVTATIMQTPGAIGYIEYGYARMTNQPMALLQNKDGAYVAPNAQTRRRRLASADLTGTDLRVWVTNPSGKDAYPITTFTWMLFYRNLNKPTVTEGLRKMVQWAMADGQTMADKLGYVPLPEVVVKRVLAEVPNIQ